MMGYTGANTATAVAARAFLARRDASAIATLSPGGDDITGCEVFVFSTSGERPITAPTWSGLAASLPLTHLADAAVRIHRDARGEIVRGGGDATAYFYYRVLVPKGSGAPDCVPVL